MDGCTCTGTCCCCYDGHTDHRDAFSSLKKWCARIPATPHPLDSQSVSCCHRAQGSDESFLLASTSFVVCRDTCAQLGRSIGSQPACLSEAWSRSSPCAAAKLSTVGKRGCRTRPELAERLAMLPPRHVSWLDERVPCLKARNITCVHVHTDCEPKQFRVLRLAVGRSSADTPTITSIQYRRTAAAHRGPPRVWPFLTGRSLPRRTNNIWDRHTGKLNMKPQTTITNNTILLRFLVAV